MITLQPGSLVCIGEGRQRDIGVLTRMEPASEGLTAEVGQEYLANKILEGSFYGMGSPHVKN